MYVGGKNLKKGILAGIFADPDPGSGAFLTPGSGMGIKPGFGSGKTTSRIRSRSGSDPDPDPQHYLQPSKKNIQHLNLKNFY